MIWEYDNFIVDVDNAIIYLDKTKYRHIDQYKKYVVDKYNTIIKDTMEKRTISMLDYIPTFDCLGECEYCYNKTINNKVRADLTVAKVKKAILKLEEMSINVQPILSRVYGGEPFLSKNIFDIIRYLYTIYDSFTYVSTGMFYSDDMFNDIVKNLLVLPNTQKIGIGVSCDFDLSTRHSKLNINWEDIYTRAKKLSEHNFGHVVINTVLSKFSNLDHIFDLILSNINKYNLYYRLTIASCDKEYSVTEEQLHKIYNFFINNATNGYLLTDNLPINFFDNFSFNKLEDNIYALLMYPKYCGIFSSMITIDPEGNYTNCHMNPADKTIDVNKFIDKELFLKGSTKCNACSLYLLCRGNCFYRVNRYENHNIYCKWLEYKYKIMFNQLDKNFIELTTLFN